MTNREIKLIATALRGQLSTEIGLYGENSATAGVVRLAARRIAMAIEVTEPDFDAMRFMKCVQRDIDLDDYLKTGRRS